MYAEVICDSQGIHVHPYMLRLIRKIKGTDRIILISDSFVSTELNPPALSHITDLCFDASGGLCVSKLTLDVACRNMMRHTGEKKANLVLLDKDFRVGSVMLNGRFIHTNH